ncbi:MAG: aminotransferase class I/II-fold pyridoxal phosphate-dependent enzyme [Fimbriimonadaceae bacterium]|nr:aminotransferase class I/II-fold pyridoxal phosphate-dependent enzyme [Fimbriimonadaceae bacterium]
MNPFLDHLPAYPFDRLRELFRGITPAKSGQNLGIGEPQHPTPDVILDAIRANLAGLGKYPPPAGSPGFRESVAAWVQRRHHVSADPDTQILPVSGSREGLYSVAQFVLNPAANAPPPVVLMPNPCYQIYEGAAILAGGIAAYYPTEAADGYRPNLGAIPAATLAKTQLAYFCSPGNPAGAIMTESDWRAVFALADRYGFIVVADEPYSEIYHGDEPPVGAWPAAVRAGFSLDQLIVFNSLSKRSSAPGLRSGFALAGAGLMTRFRQFRTYHGAVPSLTVQLASAAAWDDELHVIENRARYRQKIDRCAPLLAEALPGDPPAGGFFLWLTVPTASRWQGDDTAFTRDLYAATGITVIPGSYLARTVDGRNPGAGHVRIALVAGEDACEAACAEIRAFAESAG